MSHLPELIKLMVVMDKRHKAGVLWKGENIDSSEKSLSRPEVQLFFSIEIFNW
jgi:hypothetical protein